MISDERNRFYKDAERLKLQKIALDQREQKLRTLNLEYVIYRSLPDSEKNTNYGIWVKQFREKIRFEKSLEENPILAKIHEELSTIRKELNDKKELEKNVSLMKEKVIKLENIAQQSLKLQTKYTVNSVEKSMKDMSDDLKNENDKKLIETKLNLLESEFDLYRDDIKHLHIQNLDEASDIAHDEE